jgi:hypothetical protein
MGLLVRISEALVRLGRVLGLGEPPQAEAVEAPTPIPAPSYGLPVPAVAGFVMRNHRTDFLLGRRIASVARLNTPVGRKPRMTSKVPLHRPPMPTARLGAKRTRLDGNVGPRVLKRPPPQGRSAEIIPFPESAWQVEKTHVAMAHAA